LNLFSVDILKVTEICRLDLSPKPAGYIDRTYLKEAKDSFFK